ncbi:hypothetical protein HQ520_15410, partial [bacterium]|nr:hypothetical protein [bacterium]
MRFFSSPDRSLITGNGWIICPLRVSGFFLAFCLMIATITAQPQPDQLSGFSNEELEERGRRLYGEQQFTGLERILDELQARSGDEPSPFVQLYRSMMEHRPQSEERRRSFDILGENLNTTAPAVAQTAPILATPQPTPPPIEPGPAPVETSFADRVPGGWVTLDVAGLLALTLILVLVFRRRTPIEPEEEEPMAPPAPEPEEEVLEELVEEVEVQEEPEQETPADEEDEEFISMREMDDQEEPPRSFFDEGVEEEEVGEDEAIQFEEPEPPEDVLIVADDEALGYYDDEDEFEQAETQAEPYLPGLEEAPDLEEEDHVIGTDMDTREETQRPGEETGPPVPLEEVLRGMPDVPPHEETVFQSDEETRVIHPLDENSSLFRSDDVTLTH